jgi:hypothetical protein
MSGAAAGIAVDGGDRVAIVAIVAAIVRATAVGGDRDIERAIEPGNATRAGKTCTTASVTNPEQQHRAKHATRPVHLHPAHVPTMYLRTRVAMSIAELTREVGNRKRRMAGRARDSRQATSNLGQIQHKANHRNALTVNQSPGQTANPPPGRARAAAMRIGISS